MFLQKGKLSKKEVPWFNSYIQKCIDEAYSRWKHFKTNAFRDDFKSLRNKVNFAIRKAKESFYENKFKRIVNSKKTWDAIREMGVCNKDRDNNLSAINVNDLIENFVNINMPVVQFDYYKNKLINFLVVIKSLVNFSQESNVPYTQDPIILI